MNENRQAIVNKTVKTGISFGSALAMVISYTTWHSVGWAILHGLLSWVYVIYFVIRYKKATAQAVAFSYPVTRRAARGRSRTPCRRRRRSVR